jgi:hypothetical protein
MKRLGREDQFVELQLQGGGIALEAAQQWEMNWHRNDAEGLKFKNPAAPAVKREAEEEWGR